MTSDEILFDCEERMEKAVKVFRDELRGLRTGRATPALVDSLRVEYYGSPTPLKQMAQISTPDPSSIVIRPFDPCVLKDIEKAIRSSDLGMSPNNDGKMIRLHGAADVRRAAAEDGDAHQEIGRGGQGRLPQRPPRRQQGLRHRREEQGDDRGRPRQGQGGSADPAQAYEDKIGEMADKKAKEILEQ